MRLWKVLALLVSHGVVGMVGFAAGIFVLPILIAPEPPSAAEVAAVAGRAAFHGEFRRDLAGSDALHFGEGRVHLATDAVAMEGRLAPGPNYGLYLSPEFVETEADFERVRPRMQRLGRISGFDGFVLPLAEPADLDAHVAVVVWCDSFEQFITAARYR